MAKFIQKLEINRFKSIEHLNLELQEINVLIGANGSGKSNLLSFFKMLRHIAMDDFDHFVTTSGGADKFLYYGSKETQKITATIGLSDIEEIDLELFYRDVDRLSYEDTKNVNADQYLRIIDSLINLMEATQKYCIQHEDKARTEIASFRKFPSIVLDDIEDCPSIIFSQCENLLLKVGHAVAESSITAQNLQSNIRYITRLLSYTFNDYERPMIQRHLSVYDPRSQKNFWQLNTENMLDNLYPNAKTFLEYLANALEQIHGHFKELRQLIDINNPATIALQIKNFITPNSIQVFHLDDTSRNSVLRRTNNPAQDDYLLPDCSNLVIILKKIKDQYPDEYMTIENAIYDVIPDFKNFYWNETASKDSANDISNNRLRWVHKYYGDPAQALGVEDLSDGSLRYIALATILLMPKQLKPQLIIIDEPELGLHPMAIAALSDLIHIANAESETQIIITTQSAEFLNYFDENQIITIDKKNKNSVFKCWHPEELEKWLEKYSVSQLWKMNVLGARP